MVFFFVVWVIVLVFAGLGKFRVVDGIFCDGGLFFVCVVFIVVVD